MTNLRDSIDLGLKIIATCVALFGVGTYFHDISIERQLNARSAALQRINAFGAGKTDEARSTLFDFWTENYQVVNFLMKNKISDNAFSNFIVPAFSSSKNSKNLYEAVYTISQHYDDIFFCLSSSICDAEMIEQYYCSKTLIIYSVYRPIIESLQSRSGYLDFGIGLRSLNDHCTSILGE